MDIGIAEVRKSEKKHWGGGPRATLRGPNSALGGPRATPKVYKLTPVVLRYFSFKLQFTPKLNFRCKPQQTVLLILTYETTTLVVDAKKLPNICFQMQRENFIKRFCVTGTHRFKPHFCENSGLRGINWWNVSHLV